MHEVAPKISIIVPVYEAEDYLVSCVRAIQAQTCTSWELFLIEDGSQDGSWELCQQLAQEDARIHLHHQDNCGPGAARNWGLEQARGEFVAFADADDWTEPNMYAELMNLLESSGADLAACGWNKERLPLAEKEKLGGPSPALEVPEICTFSREEYLLQLFRYGTQKCVFYVHTKLFRRAAIGTVRFPEYYCGEDVAFIYRVLLNVKTVVETSAKYYHYYSNPNSVTATLSDHDFELLPIWDGIVQLAQQSDKNHVWHAQQNRNRCDFTLLGRLIRADDPTLDAQYAVQQRELLVGLKQHEKELLAYRIPLGRKFLIFCMCRNYTLTQAVMRCGYRLRRLAAGKPRNTVG